MGTHTNIYIILIVFHADLEPAYYEEGKFGVRLENILEVVEAFGGKPDEKGNVYLTFQDATLVPYEPKLIDFNMMTLYQVHTHILIKIK